MADESNEQGGAPAGGVDVGLRTQMAASEFMLRHGAKIAGGVVVALIGIGAYGLWRSSYIESQRAVTASIADVEADLGADMVQLGQARAMGVESGFDESKARKAADDLAAIARESSGTAADEAALKAAELYRLVGDGAQRRVVLELVKGRASGVLHYAAVSGLAMLDLEENRGDDAVANLKSLQQGDAFLARQATLDLAASFEALGRMEDAVKAYDEYLTRWPDASDKEDVAERRLKASEGQG